MGASLKKLNLLSTLLVNLIIVILFQNCGADGFRAKSLLGTSQLASSNDDTFSNNDTSSNDDTTSSGTKYYMSPRGNDNNNGTFSSPWKTLDRLQTAISDGKIKPGDTVFFRGGDYLIHDQTDRNYYSWNIDGTESAPVTFKNYESEIPYIVYDRRIFDATSVEKSRTLALYIPGEYINVVGINFRQTEESRRLAVIGNDDYLNKEARVAAIKTYGKNVIIKGCVIDNFSGMGIYQGDTSNNLKIEECTIKNVANHNLYLSGKNGIIRKNSLDGTRHIDGARTIQLQYVTSIKNKIYQNTISNGSADAVVFSGRLSGNEVFNNVIINGGNGRTSGVAVGAACWDGTPGPGNRFYNNTIIGKSHEGLFSASRCETGLINCDFPEPEPKDPMTEAECAAELALNRPTIGAIEIHDNIFHPTTGTPTGLTTELDVSNFKNNIFYNSTGTVPAGNRVVNPMLVNPLGLTALSAMLNPGSPAINAGRSSIFPENDFRGALRPAQYDIGAFEFGAP